MAYVTVVQSEVRKAIESDPVLKRASYSVRVLLKISADGVIQDIELTDPDGDDDRDAAIKKLLTSLTLSQKPPSGLPPVRLQLASR